LPLFDEQGRRVGSRGGVSWKQDAGIDFPELKDVTAKQAASAIRKDADNPTYSASRTPCASTRTPSLRTSSPEPIFPPTGEVRSGDSCWNPVVRTWKTRRFPVPSLRNQPVDVLKGC
jgi:hypothetical protein